MPRCKDRFEGQLRANVYGATKWVVADLDSNNRIVDERDLDDQPLTYETAKAGAAFMNAMLNAQRERHGRCTRTGAA